MNWHMVYEAAGSWAMWPAYIALVTYVLLRVGRRPIGAWLAAGAFAILSGAGLFLIWGLYNLGHIDCGDNCVPSVPTYAAIRSMMGVLIGAAVVVNALVLFDAWRQSAAARRLQALKPAQPSEVKATLAAVRVLGAFELLCGLLGASTAVLALAFGNPVFAVAVLALGIDGIILMLVRRRLWQVLAVSRVVVALIVVGVFVWFTGLFQFGTQFLGTTLMGLFDVRASWPIWAWLALSGLALWLVWRNRAKLSA